ncbi:MAG: hypothetical protein RBR97_17430 [Bacteroidales bacterium]|nr:hypothetical protein [Bacteroidales bacterium]
MVSIITFLWNNGYRDYSSEHVNRLAKDVNQHCSFPYRFICVYDQIDHTGFDLNYVEPVALPESAWWTRSLKNPRSDRLPSSYRRLWAFSKEAECLGERIMLLDVDCLVVADLKPLFDYSDADFVGWSPALEYPLHIKRRSRRNVSPPGRIGGGTWLLTTGTYPYIWEELNINNIRKAASVGWNGSDQGWLSFNFAGKCICWPSDIGIYNSQESCAWDAHIPENAKIIHFNGKVKPWDTDQSSRKWYAPKNFKER